MSHTPPTELEARPLRRVSSLVLNSPVLPVRRSEAKKTSGEENIQYGSSKAKHSDVFEEIVPDSEEERIRFIYTHILLLLLPLIPTLAQPVQRRVAERTSNRDIFRRR